MAFPTTANPLTSTESTATTSHEVPVHGDVVEGDLLIVLLATDVTAEFVSLSGFTTLYTDFHLHVFAKIAAGDEVSPLLAASSEASQSAVHVYRVNAGTWSGVLSEAEGVHLVGANGLNPPEVTPAWGAQDTLWIAGMGCDDDEIVSGFPTDFIGTAYLRSTVGGGGECTVASCRRQLNAASLDPGAFAIGTSEVAFSVTIAISPVYTPPTPVITDLSPADDATGVSLQPSLVATFDIPISADASDGGLLLRRFSDDVLVDQWSVSNPLVDITSNVLTKAHSGFGYLSYETEYYVQVGDDFIEEWDGIAKPDWSFTTEDVPPPALIALTPTDDATDVPIDAALILQFDLSAGDPHGVGPGTGSIVVRRVADDSVFASIPIGDPQVEFDLSLVSVSLSAALEYATEYYVEIASGVIVRDYGSAPPWPGITTPDWTFTTVDFPPATILSTSPANLETGVSPTANLSIQFSEDMQAVSGNVSLHTTSGLLVEQWDVTDPDVDITDDTMTITRSVVLSDVPIGYYVTMEPGAVESIATSVDFPGILDDITLMFTVRTPRERVVVSQKRLVRAT
jgi:hypothetical protein